MRIILLFVIASILNVITVNAQAPTISKVAKKSYNGSDVSCSGNNDAELTVIPSPGQAPLTYSMNGGTFQQSNVFSNLAAGHYYFVAKNSHGTVSNRIDIDVSSPNLLRITSLFNTGGNYGGSVSCYGASDGSFGISIDGGTGKILVSKDNGANYQSSLYFDKLAVGTYLVKIKDVNGCTATANYTVKGPDPVSATFNQTDFSCATAKGTVVITPVGGAGNGFYYNVDNGATTWNTTFSNLSSGNHNVKVTDSRGCNSTFSFTVSSAAPAPEISYAGTPFCSSMLSAVHVTRTGAVGGTYSASPTGLNINSASGDIIPSKSTPGTYTVTYAIPTSGGCAAFSTYTNISIVAPGTWTGKVDNNWDNASNWICGLPNSNTDAYIPQSASVFPTVSSNTAEVKNVNIEKNASVTVLGTLKIAGNISNNGTFDATNGTLEMKGSTSQTISGSLFVNRTIRNLKISTAAGFRLSETANDTLNITGLLSFGVSSASFKTNDNLTLKSTAAGTAGVADLTNNGANKGNGIFGNVIVERYINTGTLPGQHNKSWVMVSTPTQGQTIMQSWMESGDKSSTGYGTQVTGNGIGFDVKTSTPGLKYYNDVADTWIGVTNTNDPVYNQNGYLLFVRGDRSAAFPNYNNTTLRTKGKLVTGTQPSITVKAGKFQSVGNPYAAEVDIRKITTSNVSLDIIIWDATLTTGSVYGLGAYQTLYKLGSNYYNLLSSPAYGPAGTVNNFIKSGLAFFVQAFNKDGQLTFTEKSKSSQAGVGIALRNESAGDTVATIITNLLGVRADGSTFVADGTVQQFSDDFSNEVDDMDSRKIANSTENLSIRSGGKNLVIERRSKLTAADTIFYNLTGVANQNYRFQTYSIGLQGAGLQGFIVDHYTNTQTPLSPEGITTLDFTVTSAAASRVANRFNIVFKTIAALPVTIASVKAVQKNSNVDVEWKVENQSKTQQYEIEKSADGNQFAKVASIAANNSDAATYNWLDAQAATGYNYYRIRSVDVNGQAAYSQVVKVQMGASSSAISVYPNPAVNATVNVQLTNQPEGVYYVRLINPLGQVIVSKQIVHNEGSSTEVVKWNNRSAKGNYHLEITKPGGTTETVSLLY